MKKNYTFYVCSHCGNVVTKLQDQGVPVFCCGERMQELVPGAVDAAVEKHMPVVQKQGSCLCVSVGEVVHPMSAEHAIQFIAVVQGDSLFSVRLSSDQPPQAKFYLDPSQTYTVYAYCNLHGLWELKGE